MKFRWKILIYIISAAILAIGSLSIAVFLKYKTIAKKAAVINISEKPVLRKDKDVVLGNVVSMDCKIECPWNISPKDVALKTAKGTQQVSHSLIKLSRILWGKWVWSISFYIQPFRTGKISEGECLIRFTDNTVRKLKIPGFSVKGVKTKSSKLELAPDIKISKVYKNHKQLLTILGALLIFVLLILVLLWWRKKNMEKEKRILPLWSIALTDIKELSDLLKKGLISGEMCIVKLTDIVRRYLEGYLNVKAETKTTQEFLKYLKTAGSPLSERHKSFLEDFLNAADLVKFAKLPADTRQIEEAIEKANNLIKETIKPKEDKEKGDKKNV